MAFPGAAGGIFDPARQRWHRSLARRRRRSAPHPIPGSHERLGAVGHRRVPPYGMAGGAPGAVGRNSVIRADGTVVEVGGCDTVAMQPGDVFVIETPGGGGYGAPAT